MITKRRIALALVFLVVPFILGVMTVLGRRADREPPAVVGVGVATPSPRPPLGNRPLAVVVAGNRGTEITDTLPVLEMLAASGAFEVRIVAPERRISPFYNAGLDFAPDMSFAEYASLVGRPPALIVVPYILRWQSDDEAVVHWLRAHASATTPVLSICAGAELVAAAGLFDGHRATANDANLEALAARHPNVRWERDVRWVRDGSRISSGTLAAGIDATLAAIHFLAGQAAVDQALAATRYPHARFLASPRAVAATQGLGTVLEAAFRWERTRVSIELVPGVSESEVAGLMEAYAATISAGTVAIAPELRVIRTRHGIGLVPRATVARVGAVDHRIPMSNAGAMYGYDRALLEVARTHDGATARVVAGLINYPSEHLQLSGGLPVGLTMLVRALLIGALAALAAGSLAHACSRKRELRQEHDRPLAVEDLEGDGDVGMLVVKKLDEVSSSCELAGENHGLDGRALEKLDQLERCPD